MIRRPVLAPGLRALLHPSGQVQVGLSAEHRIRVPNEPAVRRTLAILERGEALPDTPEFCVTATGSAGPGSMPARLPPLPSSTRLAPRNGSMPAV
jgi:hypothetical protein